MTFVNAAPAALRKAPRPPMSSTHSPALPRVRTKASADRGPVLVIQHIACESPGLVKSVLTREGWELNHLRLHRHDRLPPRLGSARGLVILGGPMGVYDGDQYSFLENERRLIEEALELGRPVLGVCLGSQLLAATLGATVTTSPRREIGWHTVHFTRAATVDPVWQGATDDLMAFHWHGDRFELPQGAQSLGWSSLTECQAFRWGRSAYGILFHLEVDQRAVERMTAAFQAELLSTGQRPSDILSEAGSHLPGLEKVGSHVFERWAKLLAQE